MDSIDERKALLSQIDVLLSEHEGVCHKKECNYCVEIRSLGLRYELLTYESRMSRGINSSFTKTYLRDVKRYSLEHEHRK